MSENTGFATVEMGGMQVSSTSETAEQISESLKPSEPAKDEPREVTPGGEDAGSEDARVSKAAAELGKKGGEAAAAKRKAEAKEKPADEPEETEAEPEVEKVGKPRDDPKARIAQVIRERKEIEARFTAESARREAAERRIADLERSYAQPRTEQAPAPRDPNAKPSAEDFDSYEDFVDARAAWKFRDLQREAGERHQAMAYHESIQGSIRSFSERVSKAAEADPDLVSRVSQDIINLRPSFKLEEGERPGPLNVIADEIISSEHGPALMLHLTDHPDVFQRLAALQTPREISREMARLELSLGAATTAASPRPAASKANPPLRPVSGSPHTDSGELGEDASVKEHARRWNQREAARR